MVRILGVGYKYLGRFKTEPEAANAVREAMRELEA
jgi:hypothetical protein